MDDKKPRQSSGSLFLSVPGLIILAFFFVLSLIMKANIISIFLLLFLLLCIIAGLWSKKVSKQVQADGRALTTCCFPGDEIILELSLHNNGPLAAVWTDLYLPFLHAELASPKCGTFCSIEMKDPAFCGIALHQKFTWISGYQTLSCKTQLLAHKRGILHSDYIYLHTGDGFGIGTARCGNLPTSPVSIAIFPKLYPVNTQNLLLRGSTLNTGKRGQYEDVTLVKNIRLYQHGDNFKRINWRMLAKQQDVLVNLYEKITPESIFFVLDMEGFSYQAHRPGGNDNDMMDCIHETEFELAISAIASCIVALSDQGVACGLILPGYQDVPAAFIYGENNALRTEELLYRLAEINYTGGAVNWQGAELESLSSGSGACYVLTHTSCTTPLAIYDFIETATTLTYEHYDTIIEVETSESTT